MYKETDEENYEKHDTKCNAAEQCGAIRHDWSAATSGVQTVIVWTKHTTYKHKASALRGSYLGPSVNSTAQNESIKRALRWFLFI